MTKENDIETPILEDWGYNESYNNSFGILEFEVTPGVGGWSWRVTNDEYLNAVGWGYSTPKVAMLAAEEWLKEQEYYRQILDSQEL